jgi:hypothetical protein
MDIELANTIASYNCMEVREDYSGRAMYGDSTAGVVGSSEDFFEGLIRTAIEAGRDDDDEMINKLKELNVNTDSMGLDTIFY